MAEDGSIQNDGKGIIKGATKSSCVSRCDEFKESTACKWNTLLSRCSVYTSPVTHGSNGSNGICWVFQNCITDGKQKCKLNALFLTNINTIFDKHSVVQSET